MGEFDGKQRWKIYLDEETRKRVHEISQHLEKNYEGPSDYVQQKLMAEKTLSVEQQIEKKETELESIRSDIQQLKQIKREREQMDKLRDKKELLKQKQEQLRKVADKEVRSEEQVRQDVVESFREKAETSPKISDPEEWLESSRTQRKIERKVQSRINSEPEVDKLVEDVQRLQQQVSELNGGTEDWFMDLQQEEVEA